MKKLLAFTLSLATLGFVASSIEAQATESSSPQAAIFAASYGTPQIRVRVGSGRRNNRRVIRRVRTVTQTRLVQNGRRTFRETYQVTYFPNGRIQTRLISRVRVR
jgi:hypothetical protein